MTNDQFWELIEVSHHKDCERHAAKLEKRLVALNAEEVAAFDRIYAEHVWAAYSWDLWAVAYLINGGCSDDGFVYFRDWLISKGRRFYETALQDPESAAKGVSREDLGDAEAECEDISQAAWNAYEKLTGKELSRAGYQELYPDEPLGVPWTEDELPVLFPKLCKKAGW